MVERELITQSAASDERLLLPFEESQPSRRSFLRLVGFGIAAGTIEGCSRAPEHAALSYLVAPPELVPGEIYALATTCGACSAACGVLARCRDGRPIKLEGAPDCAVGRGGLCATGQAAVLGLYDSRRLDGPHRGGAASTWREADDELRARCDELRTQGGKLRLLSGSVHSPSTRATIENFLAGFPDARHVSYDTPSLSALLDAHEQAFAVRVVPRMRFERARLILSYGADFLGTWISPVEFAAGWASGRMPDDHGRLARHVQLEARMSLTGSKADERHLLAPWEVPAALACLCAELERLAGKHPVQPTRPDLGANPLAARLAEEAWGNRAATLVVCDSNDLEAQLLCAYANELLESYGTTLDLASPSLAAQGDDRALARLRDELEAGEIALLVVAGDVNPAFELPELAPALQRAGLLVSLASSLDETSALAGWILPEPHFLEAWNDAEPVRGELRLTQPAVPALRSTRSLRATLAAWMADDRDERELLAAHWREHVWPRVRPDTPFETFFTTVLERGRLSLEQARGGSIQAFDTRCIASLELPSNAPSLVCELYPSIALREGRLAHNPWLQELPDPLTKLVWGNALLVAPAFARERGLEDGDMVRVGLRSSAHTVELPVRVQPGQDPRVVAAALGYGRLGSERFAGIGPDWIQARPTLAAGERVGASVEKLAVHAHGDLRRNWGAVVVEPTGKRVELASVQEYDWLALPAHLAPQGAELRHPFVEVSAASLALHGLHPHGAHDPSRSLWSDDHPTRERKWGMAIDLARCIGCSACMVACQAENNVPVVGRDEVRRHREMHWLRIDRYWREEDGQIVVAHQPMLCQQCGDAPCESVCPVLATVHSSEGLNQQVYNRCVGTRYCANTCPYKVRRFNWFDYPHEDALANAALNPDVTVRSRGVMEKCSFCVQRIAAAKAQARREGRALADGDVQPACMQSCPTKAIAFGDTHDPASRVSQSFADVRAYAVLEEVGTRPSIRYLAAIRNTREDDDDATG